MDIELKYIQVHINKETEIMEITKDANGKGSSKRIAGLIISGIGVIIMGAVGVCSFFFKLADPSTAFNSGLSLLSVGSGLLGISIGEHIANAIKSKNNNDYVTISEN